MKKKRLKRSVKRKLIKAWVFTKRVSIASLVSVGTVQTFPPVHAKVNENEIIKVTAQLQHKSLSDVNTLKEIAVDTHNSVYNTSDTAENTKVYVTTPTVVTTPTINNATITVVADENKISDENTVNEEENVTSTDTAEETKSNETSTSKDTANATTSSDSAVEETSTKQDSNQKSETKDVAEVEAASKVSDTNSKKEDSVKEENTTVTFEDTSKAIATATPDAQVLPVSSNSEETDLDNVEVKEASETSSIRLILSTENITLDSSEDFSPEDYILDIGSSDDMLPALNIDNNVNTAKDGEYTVTYKATDLKGNSITKTLNVTVKTTEETIKQRQEATEKAIQTFVDETSGKHIDVDGYYGDQCWDLWGYFNKTMGLTDFDASCSPYGYVYGIPLKYKTSGASQYYKYIKSGDTLKVGDWLFWNKGSSYKDSHVALLLGINEDGTLKCLTQSYGEGTRILDLQPDVMAAFRLKDTYAWWKLGSN